MREYPHQQAESGRSQENAELTGFVSASVEHGDVKVVAVNDPFIEPKYAVSLILASCSLFDNPSVGRGNDARP